MVYACASGKLPWWLDDDRDWSKLPLCGGNGEPREYILCCGHTVSPKQANRLIEANLMRVAGVDKHGRPLITIGSRGHEFLAEHLDKVEFDG